MKTNKNCKHCYQIFESRRSNHEYCTPSCKTKASYKRNEYKYVSGHYRKDDSQMIEDKNIEVLPQTNQILESIKVLESKITASQPTPEINGTSITNSALGTTAANSALYAAKKIFAPNTLAATKGDLLTLRNELNGLKAMIQLYIANS
ncbi:MAG: hypothetical protein V7719_17845 [Psychroserpens sp.]|uniref:hypothetical protein n=1 Tax=Psychroserpens sp. TaxID=2020870 RepID=UPI003003588D